MHTLALLIATISALSLEPALASQKSPWLLEATKPIRPQGISSLTLGASLDPGFHLVNTLGNEQGNDAANRIFLELLVGTGAGILGGSLTSLAMGINLDSPTSLAVPLSVLLLGSSVGVTLVGSLMEGRGIFGYALLGGTISCVLPILLGLTLQRFSGCSSLASDCGNTQPIVVSLLGLFIVPPVGALVGYELSAPKSWLLLAGATRETPAPPRVIPVLIPASQGLGATVGIAGTL
jgi:hypothetical protein